MNFKITDHKFRIIAENIEPTLNALKEVYPEVQQILDFQKNDENLQYLLWILGYNSRRMDDESMFDLFNSAYDSAKIENEDFTKTLTCLSKFMTDDSFIIVESDGKEIRFEKDNIIVKAIETEEVEDLIDEDEDEFIKNIIEDINNKVIEDIIKEENDIVNDESIEKEVYEINTDIDIIKDTEELPVKTVISKSTKKRGRKPKNSGGN